MIQTIHPHEVISRGPVSGSYQAFPDLCRLQNGDILAVFYGGYHHISFPSPEYPRGGRICMLCSRDEGRTWSTPEVLYDDEHDDRDPHISQLPDGTLLCSFFSILPSPVDEHGWPTETVQVVGVQITRSTDGGQTWEGSVPILNADAAGWACSAPVRILPDGSLGLGVYRCGKDGTYGGIVRSTDGGRNWSAPIPIGREANRQLPAETDVIGLQDSRLLAVLRGDENEGTHMHAALSTDCGRTWTPAWDMGFLGHCPHLTRLQSGRIFLTYRAIEFREGTKHFFVGLRFSDDEGLTWRGPFVLDEVIGAYASTLELPDGSVLAIYYEEGVDSAIRALRFRLGTDLEFLPLSDGTD